MRTGMLVSGVILFLLGVGLFIGAGTMDAAAQACASERSGECQREGYNFLVTFARNLRLAGGLVLIAGVGLGVAGGILKSPKELAAEATTAQATRAPVAASVPVTGTPSACPHCAKDNLSGARFCAHCGKAMVRPCPSCNADMPPKGRYCAACGAAVAPLA